MTRNPAEFYCFSGVYEICVVLCITLANVLALKGNFVKLTVAGLVLSKTNMWCKKIFLLVI